MQSNDVRERLAPQMPLKSVLKYAITVMERAKSDRHWDDEHYWSKAGFGGNTMENCKRHVASLDSALTQGDEQPPAPKPDAVRELVEAAKAIPRPCECVECTEDYWEPLYKAIAAVERQQAAPEQTGSCQPQLQRDNLTLVTALDEAEKERDALREKARENEQVFLRVNAECGDLRMQVDRLTKELDRTRADEREACAKAMCYLCIHDIPVELTKAGDGKMRWFHYAGKPGRTLCCYSDAIRRRGEQG